MNTNTNAHRETWLNRLAALMAPKFEELGHPVPAVRIAIGFTGSNSKDAIGVCWHKSASADGVFEIFIRPDQADPMQVAAILAHEMTHAAVGFACGHKGAFAEVVQALGFVRPLTQLNISQKFEQWAAPLLALVGSLPHAALMFRDTGGGMRKPGDEQGGDGAEGEGEGGSSNDKPKQSTRMLKACCAHEADGKVCGYTVRLTRKWALELGAACPVHGSMEVEGLEDAQREQQEEGADA